jgi:arabinose-5-phosphate isomerase
MTHKPKTITKKTLAAKAVALMEKYTITVLVVADDESNIEGIIHLHDLLKAGIL